MRKRSMHVLLILKKHNYDRISRDKLWAVLLQYGIDGQGLTVIKPLYMHSEDCVRVRVIRATTKPFRVGVGQREYTVKLLSFPYSVLHIYRWNS